MKHKENPMPTIEERADKIREILSKYKDVECSTKNSTNLLQFTYHVNGFSEEFFIGKEVGLKGIWYSVTDYAAYIVKLEDFEELITMPLEDVPLYVDTGRRLFDFTAKMRLEQGI
jgi:hypothetical protein